MADPINLVSWIQLERAILRRVNALRGTKVTADTVAKQTSALTSADTADAAFPLFQVRLEGVQMVNELAGYLARQVGNPYRALYSQKKTITAGLAAPVSMGPYGGINYLDTTKTATDADYRVPFEEAASPQDVIEIVKFPNLFGTDNYQYCVDGSVVYSTKFPIEWEVFIYNRVGVGNDGHLVPATVEALFNNWDNEANLPNELLSIAADGAAARLASQASAYVENAGALWNAFITQMRDRGFSVVPSDFALNPNQ